MSLGGNLLILIQNPIYADTQCFMILRRVYLCKEGPLVKEIESNNLRYQNSTGLNYMYIKKRSLRLILRF